MRDKRVLVLSHNAFSNTQNNGKTLESFFERWDKGSIAQLFLQPDPPDFNFCNRYFRITDYDIINAIFSDKKTGQRIFKTDSENQFVDSLNPIVKKLYSDRRSGKERRGFNKLIHKGFVARIPVLVMLRDLLWAFSEWRSDSLVEWIKEFNPEVLFFQGSNSVFGYNIALWICNEFKIPLILELTDDYTTGIYPCSFFEVINKHRYRNIFIRAIQYAHKVIAISSYMAIEYKKRFGGDYIVLMNSVKFKALINETMMNGTFKFLYAGNVLINRWKVLKRIGNALSELNRIYGFRCKLCIYTPLQLSDRLRAELTSVESIDYCGTLNQEELATEIQMSNILVHVESFDNRMKKITRLSISTKIPEYMASKRCIFAVGPSDVASIRYLKENQYAQVVEADNTTAIKISLIELLNNEEMRKNFIQSAYDAYCIKHHPDSAQDIIHNVIESACQAKVVMSQYSPE